MRTLTRAWRVRASRPVTAVGSGPKSAANGDPVSESDAIVSFVPVTFSGFGPHTLRIEVVGAPASHKRVDVDTLLVVAH